MSKVAGQRNGRARLEETDIPVIRALRADGMSPQEIADKFGVAQTTSSAIANRKRWRHVEEV